MAKRLRDYFSDSNDQNSTKGGFVIKDLFILCLKWVYKCDVYDKKYIMKTLALCAYVFMYEYTHLVININTALKFHPSSRTL